MGNFDFKKLALGLWGLSLIIIVLGFVLDSGVFFGKKSFVVTETVSNTFYVEYDSGTTLIELNNKTPLSDKEAKELEGFKININNLREEAAIYHMKFIDVNYHGISSDKLKIMVLCDGYELVNDFVSNFGKDLIILDNRKLEGLSTDNLEIKIWISEHVTAVMDDAVFNATVKIEKFELTEDETKDITPPVITLKGDSEVVITKGQNYKDEGILEVKDNIDGDISLDKVVVSYQFLENGKFVPASKIDTHKVGIYYVYYKVKDKASNEAVVFRIVKVEDESFEKDEEKEPLNLRVIYSTTEKTSDNVIVTIVGDTPLMNVKDWVLNEDKLSLTRSFSTNVSISLPIMAEDGRVLNVSISISNIDKTEVALPTPEVIPTPDASSINVSLETSGLTSNSVTITAKVSNKNRVAGYYYKCGDVWSSMTVASSFTCSDLFHNTNYDIQVKVVDSKTNLEVLSKSEVVKTLEIPLPSFISDGVGSWALSRNITIVFPEKRENWTYQYRLNDGGWLTVLENPVITLADNSVIMARIIDGSNEVVASYIEQKIDNKAPVLTDKTITKTGGTTNSLALNWKVASDESTDLNNLKYYLCSSKNNDLNIDNCQSTYLVVDGFNLTDYTVTNLESNTTYYFGVVVKDQFGHTSFYDVFSSKTEMVLERYDLANKTGQVGILYSTWFNPTMDLGTPSLISSGKYNTNQFYYWGEPALGFYRSDNKEVIRNHMMQLTAAGVDFIIIDNTNVATGWISSGGVFDTSSYFYKMVTSPMKALLDTLVEMRNEGLKTPYVVNWVNTSGGDYAVLNVMHNLFVSATYDPSLGNSKYEDLWVYWNEKPFFLVTKDLGTPDRDITYRVMWGLQPSLSKGEWSYLQANNAINLGTDFSGKVEQMSVSVAMQKTYMSNANTTHPNAIGRNGGCTWYNQWKNAFNTRPKILTITWWNEWQAQALLVNGTYKFTDLYNMEYSRDIEPMKGGHGDQYYQWLKQYIAAYKGNGSCPKLTSGGTC